MGQPPIHGAAVTLRYQGSIVGRGVAITGEPAGSPGILMMATSRAMNEARTRLPVPHDALEQENLQALAPMLSITVEVAGRPVPIAPKEWADTIEEIGPGLDGVAVRMGERIEAMFPETMIVTGTDAAGAFRALVSKVSGDPTLGLKKPAELREKEGVDFLRFRVTSAGHVGTERRVEAFQRGGRLVSLSGLTQPELRRWAEQMAAHLLREATPDGIERLATMDGDGALVSWALLRAVLAGIGGQTLRDRTLELCDSTLTSLAEVRASRDRTRSAALAAILLADRTAAAPSKFKSPVDDDVQALISELPRMPDRTWDDGPRLRSADRALVIYALTHASTGMSLEDQWKLAAGALAEVPPAEIVSQMPWLGWAASPIGSTSKGPVDVPAAPALREMRAQLWEHQLRAESLVSEEADLAGGIAFVASQRPMPTSQAARPLAFVATMLGDERLTGKDEVSAELARLLESLRFLRQLTADEAECHMYKDPATALGGVRNSLFDQRMPPEATAMTLLTVCETLKSLDAIKARQAAPKPGPSSKPETSPNPAPK
jgi:hypothetical protein